MLVFDERASLAGQAGLHALIVGVSSYLHLPGGKGRLARHSYDMEQLTSAAISSYRIYQWLRDRREYLPANLATVRLLLSPSAQEVAAEPELAHAEEPCTLDSFVKAANEWRTDACHNEANVTFFYFAGHGLQRSKEDTVLLLEDFADPNLGAILSRAISMNNLVSGMAGSVDFPHIAQTQLYFLDCCRVLPRQFKSYEQLEPAYIFDSALVDEDRRNRPVFYSALPGTQAYANKGQQTIFSQAMLDCLNGLAAKAVQVEDDIQWHVTVHSLSERLSLHCRELYPKQTFELVHWSDDISIHRLDEPPNVTLALELDPAIASLLASLEISNAMGAVVRLLPRPLESHPIVDYLPAGTYRFRIMFDPANMPYQNYERLLALEPPRFKWIARLRRE